jgi:uncharacterized protein YtpQ (UPF0354 family)
MSPAQQNLTSRAIAYLKAAVPEDDDAPVIELSHGDSPVVRQYAERLCICYLVDEGTSYRYVQYRDLLVDGIDEETLHRIGIDNLSKLTAVRTVRVHPYQGVFAVVMGGDFEASLILLNQFWNEHFRQFVAGDYVAAIPARDILAFCDSTSSMGIEELHRIVERCYPVGDHLISNRLFARHQSTWNPV